MITHKKFDEREAAIVQELYGQVERAVDSLPYSPDFTTMYQGFSQQSQQEWTENEFFVAMTSLRKKKGGLKKPR